MKYELNAAFFFILSFILDTFIFLSFSVLSSAWQQLQNIRSEGCSKIQLVSLIINYNHFF